MPKLEKRILEELIYERLRVTVDLCELLTFEADLARSIERALARCARSPQERKALAETYLRRAWTRLGEEMVGHVAFCEDLATESPPPRRAAAAPP